MAYAFKFQCAEGRGRYIWSSRATQKDPVSKLSKGIHKSHGGGVGRWVVTTTQALVGFVLVSGDGWARRQ